MKLHKGSPIFTMDEVKDDAIIALQRTMSNSFNHAYSIVEQGIGAKGKYYTLLEWNMEEKWGKYQFPMNSHSDFFNVEDIENRDQQFYWLPEPIKLSLGVYGYYMIPELRVFLEDATDEELFQGVETQSELYRPDLTLIFGTSEDVEGLIPQWYAYLEKATDEKVSEYLKLGSKPEELGSQVRLLVELGLNISHERWQDASLRELLTNPLSKDQRYIEGMLNDIHAIIGGKNMTHFQNHETLDKALKNLEEKLKF